MKFALCIAAIISVALAQNVQDQPIVRRQNTQDSVPVGQPAMTDKDGNVLPFDSKNLYLDMQAKGL